MHCVSCEIILSKELKQLEWFSLEEINHKEWFLKASYKNQKQLNQAIEIIQSHNYQVVENKSNFVSDFSLQKTLIKIILLLFLWIIFYLLNLFIDINSFIPRDQNWSYFTTLMLWFIASLSTCLAITGWIVIWFSKSFSSKVSWLKWSFIIQSYFQIWRLLGFFILWGLLWLLWEFFSVSLQFSTIITLIISVVLVYIWLQVLDFVPNISKFWFHLPKWFATRVEKLKNPKMAPIVWALTFFIPCGFTQAAQLLAVSSWNFFTWGLIMLIFALWTFPVLFLLWLWSSYFSEKKFPLIEMLLWVFILLFWINALVNATNLLPSLFVDHTQQEKFTEQTKFTAVYATHNWDKIVWDNIYLDSWHNYKVIIIPENDGIWCMWHLTIPTLSDKVHRVLKWRPMIYEIWNAKPWEYKIVCSSIWLPHGKIIVK